MSKQITQEKLQELLSNRSINGSSIIHQCCARNNTELLQLLLTTQEGKSLLREKDNYGRTPLFWSLWTGSFRTAILNLMNNAKLSEQDFSGDTALHIAVANNKLMCLKTTLFYMLKKDSSKGTFCRKLVKSLAVKNKKGYTARMMAKVSHNEQMFVFLTGLENMCQQKMLEISSKSNILEVQLNSGKYNGKKLSKLEQNLKNVLIKLEEKKKRVVLHFLKKNGAEIRMIIPLNTFAFLSFGKKNKSAKMTLSQKPKVEIFAQGTWNEFKENTGVFTEFAQFTCFFENLKFLERFNAHVSGTGILHQMQPYFYCYVPTNVSGDEKKKTTSGGSSPAGKMSQLRSRFNSMNFGSKNVVVIDALAGAEGVKPTIF